MSPITIPQETADREIGTGGGRFVPPQGVYRGTLEQVHTSDFPDWAADPTNNGYNSADGETISPQFGSVVPLDVEDESADFGNRKLFVPNDRDSLVVRDGEHTLSNIDPTDGSVPYWRLVNAIPYVAKLAVALGVASNGAGGVSIPDDFLDQLVEGVFNGQEVTLKVAHTGTYETRDGEERQDWVVSDIYPA